MAEEFEGDPFAKYGGSEVKTTSTGDPFAKYGGSEVKKKQTSPVSDFTSPSLPSGLGTIPSIQALTEPSTAPYTQEYIDSQKKQQEANRQAVVDKANKQLQSDYAKLDPHTKETWQKISQASNRQSDELRQPSDEEIAHWKFMDTPVGKVVGATKYLTSKALGGTVDVIKGATHEWSKALGNPAADIGNDIVMGKLSEAANLGQTKNDIAQAENSKVLSAAGMAAEFAPAIVGGEATKAPEALMFLQGVGQGKDLADKLEIDNPIAKEALIQGTGVVNLALSDLKIFGKLPSALKGKVATGIALDALKESAGKDLSSTEFKSLLEKGANTFAEKLKRAPLEALSHYNNTVSSLTKLNIGNFALHKAVDAINNKTVFNETPGDLAANEYKMVTQDAPLFAAIPMGRELTKLTPLSNYKNSVVEHLLDHPNDAESVKSTLEQHSQEQGWSPEEVQATKDHVDKIAGAVKSLPPDMATPKKEKAVGLVLDRNDLQKDLDELQSQRNQLDPSLQETASSHEQYLTDKIDQANDKIRQLVSGKRTTYSKDEEAGKFYKTIDGTREEISPSRYDLENLERTSKQQKNEIREQQNGQETGQKGDEESNRQSQASNEENGQKEVGNATSERVEPQNNIDQHQNGNVSRETTEAGGGNSPERSGEVKQEEGSETSIKNKKIDTDREKRGLTPIMSEARKDFGTVWDGAMKKLDENPDAGRELVDELHNKPRAVDDTEVALITHILAEAKNRYDRLNEEIVKAQDAGHDMTDLEAKLDAASDNLQKIEEVSRNVGSKTSAGLNARKMMIRDDMSLANLETKKRVALGRKLTADEREDLRKVHEEYAKKEKEYQAIIEKLTQKNRDLQERQAIEKLKAEARKEARGQRSQQRGETREKLVQDIRAKLKIARTSERLNVSIPFAQQVAELYKISPELAKLAKSYIAEGIDKLEDLVDKIHEQLSEYDKRAIRDALSGYGKPVERETKPELQAKLDALKTQAKLLSKLEDLQAKEYKAPERKKAQISAEIADLKKQVRELLQPDISLKAIKTRTANQIKEYQRRLTEKDFEPAPKRTPTELDPEAIKAKADLERVRDEFNVELEKDRLANRGNWEKGWDKFLKYRRAELLLNLSGAAKVGMASMYRIVSQPLHELVGSLERQVPGLKQIAGKAPREGYGFVPDVEWKALKTVWNADTIAEVKKKFKGQLDNLDTAFGDKKEHYDVDKLLDLAGNIHAAEKEFAKQNEFRRSVLLRTKYAEEHGVDTQNPFVQIQIGMSALKDANRQIFMADNVATSAYRGLLSLLESKSSETKFGKTAKISAGILKLMLPIVKVPTNYLIEKAQYTPVLGALKAVNIMRKGLEKMTPDQADYVMRIMKKQGIGAGLVAMGYALPNNFGGFYIPGKKRDENDALAANDVSILGVKIPHFLTHTPLLTLLQLGATIRRAAAGDVAMGTANDFAESTPFYETPKEAVKAMENSNSMQQFIGNTLRGLIVPNMISQVAEHYDTDEEGNQVKRAPKSVLQGIESGIPGLREQVPIKNPHPGFDKIMIGDHEYKLNNQQMQERQKFYDDFMKTEGAKAIKLEIAKTTNKVEKEKLTKRLKSMASKVNKRRVLYKYHNSETGGYDLEKVEE